MLDSKLSAFETQVKDCFIKGPFFYYVRIRVFYKNAAQIRFTPKEVGRVFGIAKFTPTVNEIREWCKEMVEKYENQPKTQQVEGGGDETGEIEEKTKEPMVV